MAQSAHERAQEEHDFWDRQFSRREPLRSAPDHADGPSRRARVPRPVALPAEPLWSRALEWLRDRRGDPRAAVVGLVLVTVIAGFVWYRIGAGGGAASPPEVSRGATASGASTPSTTPDAAASMASNDTAGSTAAASGQHGTGTVMVHVAGAVAHPGVVELGADARVIDAVEAVGGATADGDLDRLNLAAKVADGTRVYVPRHGEADPGVLVGGAGGSAAGAATGAPSPDAKVNLNTATQAQLEELPGIGPTYAQAIIAERTRRGAFHSVNELREVRGIGEKRFAELAPLVTV